MIEKSVSLRLNIQKTIAMLAVVTIHSENIMGMTGAFTGTEKAIITIVAKECTRFAVPLFFLIASYILYTKSERWLINLKKKTKSILLPYMLWNLSWIIIFQVGARIPKLSPLFGADDYIYGLRGWLGAFGVNSIGMPFSNVLWFLQDLFLLNIFCSVIKVVIDKFPKVTLLILGIIWLGTPFRPVTNEDMIFAIYLHKQGLVMFSLGYYAVKYKLSISSLDSISFRPFAVLPLIVVLCTAIECQELASILALIEILFIMKISKKIQLNATIMKSMEYLAPYMFFIFASHGTVLSVMQHIIALLTESHSILFFSWIIQIPLVILLCRLAGVIVQKYFPAIYSVMIGGRISKLKYP